MVIIPAVCNECGTVFPGLSIAGTVSASFKRCQAGPCPQCGGFGSIKDGTYKIVESALHAIIRSAPSSNQLRLLTNILQEAQRDQAQPAALADRLEAEEPQNSEFASWVRQYLVPKNAGEVVGYLSMIIASVALMLQIMSMQQSPAQFDEKTVSNIVEKAVGSALAQTAKQVKLTAGKKRIATREAKKVSRNDPCPCHSGKKFKMCCINKAAHESSKVQLGG